MKILSLSVLFLFLAMSIFATTTIDAAYDAMRMCDRGYYSKSLWHLEDDHIVKLFLEMNPGTRLEEDFYGSWKDANYFRGRATIEARDNPDEQLHVNTDVCHDVWEYIHVSGGNTTRGYYENNLTVIESITGVEIPPCEPSPKQKMPSTYSGRDSNIMTFDKGELKEGYPDSYAGLEHLRNDLLFRAFMKVNPDPDQFISLNTDFRLWAPYTWMIGDVADPAPDVQYLPYLRIVMDRCFNVAYFGYIDLGEEEYYDYKYLRGSYDHDNNYRAILKQTFDIDVQAGETGSLYGSYYEVLKAITGEKHWRVDVSEREGMENLIEMVRYETADQSSEVFAEILSKDDYEFLRPITGKPFTPHAQVTFYEIPIHKVQCASGEHMLYIKDDTKPMCLKPDTYEKLQQRGYNLEKVQ